MQAAVIMTIVTTHLLHFQSGLDIIIFIIIFIIIIIIMTIFLNVCVNGRSYVIKIFAPACAARTLVASAQRNAKLLIIHPHDNHHYASSASPAVNSHHYASPASVAVIMTRFPIILYTKLPKYNMPCRHCTDTCSHILIILEVHVSYEYACFINVCKRLVADAYTDYVMCMCLCVSQGFTWKDFTCFWHFGQLAANCPADSALNSPARPQSGPCQAQKQHNMLDHGYVHFGVCVFNPCPKIGYVDRHG